MINNNLNPSKAVTLSVKFFPALKSIAEYLRLVESLDYKIDKLINTPLNAAIESIECAKNSQGKNQEEDLRDAVREFRKLIRSEIKSFDNADRLLIIYYGYAMCLYQLKNRKNAMIKLKEYANLNLKPSLRKQAIVKGRTFLIILPSLLVFSFILIPLLKLNEVKKINVIDNSFKKVDEWIPFGLKTKESLIEQSQNQAAKFAEEIKEIESLNILQTIFSKKEPKLLERLSEYFNNHKVIL